MINEILCISDIIVAIVQYEDFVNLVSILLNIVILSSKQLLRNTQRCFAYLKQAMLSSFTRDTKNQKLLYHSQSVCDL